MLSSLWALVVTLVPIVQGGIVSAILLRRFLTFIHFVTIKKHEIYVGDRNGSKVFTPTTVKADVNDTVIFIFLSNHVCQVFPPNQQPLF